MCCPCKEIDENSKSKHCKQFKDTSESLQPKTRDKLLLSGKMNCNKITTSLFGILYSQMLSFQNYLDEKKSDIWRFELLKLIYMMDSTQGLNL